MASLVKKLKEVVSGQLHIAKTFYDDKRVQDAIIIIWVASFGAALHAPVNTYYYLELGATEMDIGWLMFIASFGSVVCGPIYGWILDKYGSAVAIALASFACATGCLIRGCAQDTLGLYFGIAVLGLGSANLWTVVLAHIARNTEEACRADVISGYNVQVTSLQIAGKSLYPSVNYALQFGIGVTSTLPRMRIHMGQCTVFCFYGFARLLGNWNNLQDTPATDKSYRVGDKSSPSSITTQAKINLPLCLPCKPNTAIGNDCSDRGSNVLKFIFYAVLLVLQAACTIMCTILWPLFIKDRFGWDTHQYAYLMFFSSIMSTIGTAMAPSIGRSLGEGWAMSGAYMIGAVFAFFAFDQEPILHSILVTGVLTSLSFVEPLIKANASLSMPPVFQGLSFGMLSSVSGFGTMMASPAATHLYRKSKLFEPDNFFGGGSLPMMVVSMMLLSSLGILIFGKIANL